MFKKLTAAVKRDVDTANALLKEMRHASLSFEYTPGREIIIVSKHDNNRIGSETRTVIRFVLSQAEITIDSGKEQGIGFSTAPRLNSFGDCKLKGRVVPERCGEAAFFGSSEKFMGKLGLRQFAK